MPYFNNQDGYNLYYSDINGDRTDVEGTIILLHGFASSVSFFKSQIKVLKERYRIIAFDALGHGKSDHPKEVNLSGNIRYEIIRDLEDLLNYLGVTEQYGIIGHSLVGGMIAQLYTMKHSDEVKFLILLNSGYIMIDNVIRNIFYNLLPYFIRMNFLEVVQNSLEDVLDKIIPYIMTALSNHKNKHSLPEEELLINIETQIFGMINEINKYDPSSISCKTLIIGGRLDNFAPYVMSEELHEKIKNSELEIIDMAGHFAPAQREEIVNELICNFIKNIS
ncbi:MAG: alpha/beta hydrolase [Candidatus Lokiarchaeota archaeon]|nr:alpha/beta hydrolase [Candidatus Lokiarchaeota archaeon]